MLWTCDVRRRHNVITMFGNVETNRPREINYACEKFLDTGEILQSTICADIQRSMLRAERS